MSIVVYTMPNCMPCDMTKKFLTRDNREFSTIDLSTDTQAYEFVTSLGYKQTPVVYVSEDNHWAGFRVDKLAALREPEITPNQDL